MKAATPDPTTAPTPTVAPPRTALPLRPVPVEVRVVDLLATALDRQTEALAASGEQNARAMRDVAGSLGRLEVSVAQLRLTPWLIGLVALALVILGAAIGVGSTAALRADGIEVGAHATEGTTP